jgi:hypothetical protein
MQQSGCPVNHYCDKPSRHAEVLSIYPGVLSIFPARRHERASEPMAEASRTPVGAWRSFGVTGASAHRNQKPLAPRF